MAQVKICGLTEPETLAVADAAGADWVGFNFVTKSPRYIPPPRAGDLIAELTRARPIVLLVEPTNTELETACGIGTQILQLHGDETPERLADIGRRTGLEVWKAVAVASTDDLSMIGEFADVADRILLDAKPPKDADITGGHGATFDWAILDRWTPPCPWMLAGGLTPANVAEAIARTGADAVDVSSGVERARGVKDAGLIKAFITAAKARR